MNFDDTKSRQQLEVVPSRPLGVVAGAMGVAISATCLGLAALTDAGGWRYAGWWFIAGLTFAALMQAVARLFYTTERQLRSEQLAILPADAQIASIRKAWRYVLSVLILDLVLMPFGLAIYGAGYVAVLAGALTGGLIFSLVDDYRERRRGDAFFVDTRRWLWAFKSRTCGFATTDRPALRPIRCGLP